MYKDENVVVKVSEAVLQDVGLNFASLNSRILNTLGTRLYRIGVLFAKKKSCNAFKLILKKWKTDPKSQFQIKIYHKEMETMELISENEMLRDRKRKLESKLENETRKRMKLENSLT